MKALVILIAAVISIGLAAIGNVLLKIGASNISLELDRGIIARNALVLLGFVCYGGAAVLYTVVLSRVKMSVAYPAMAGATFVAVILASHVVLKENITLKGLIACGLILVGILILAYSRQ